MRCLIEILQIEENRANVEVIGGGDSMDIPLYLLPEHSQVGDILQLQINFSLYETLSRIKQKEDENSL